MHNVFALNLLPSGGGFAVLHRRHTTQVDEHFLDEMTAHICRGGLKKSSSLIIIFSSFLKIYCKSGLQFLLPRHGDDKMNWNRFNRRGKESHEMLTDELLYSLSIWFQWSIQNFYGTKFILFKVHYETALNTFSDLQQCQWQCPPSFDICEWGARKISKWNYI